MFQLTGVWRGLANGCVRWLLSWREQAIAISKSVYFFDLVTIIFFMTQTCLESFKGSIAWTIWDNLAAQHPLRIARSTFQVVSDRAFNFFPVSGLLDKLAPPLAEVLRVPFYFSRLSDANTLGHRSPYDRVLPLLTTFKMWCGRVESWSVFLCSLLMNKGNISPCFRCRLSANETFPSRLHTWSLDGNVSPLIHGRLKVADEWRLLLAR